MDEDAVEDIKKVVESILKRSSKKDASLTGRPAYEAATRLAERINYHVIRNENTYIKREGSRREVPALKKVCSCGWESTAHWDHRLASEEARMHEVSKSIDYEVD